MNKSFVLFAMIVLTLLGCQSAPKAVDSIPEPPVILPATPTPTPEVVVEDPSSIVVGNTGFSPNAQAPANTLSFALHFGNPTKIVSWRVEFLSAGIVIPGTKGDGLRLDPTVSWDGKTDAGVTAPEGNYVARLTVDYGDSKNVSSVNSAPFVVDVTPPSGSIVVSPQPFEPGDPNVLVDPPLVTIQVNPVAGGAAVSSWRLGVIHPDGRRFFDFISEDHKDNIVKWNGRALNNASMEAGTTYELVAQVFDRYGNVGVLKGALLVAAPSPVPDEVAPVTVSLDGKLIAETTILFPANSADLSKVLPWKAAKNAEAFDLLATTLRPVTDKKIHVIGHANKVFWQDQASGDREQTEVLIPLSLARAQTVRDSLVALGLDSNLFEVSGLGAEGAVVPFSDLVNNWKNRRVEFVVEP